MAVTTDAILQGVKDRAIVPSNQVTLTDDKILKMIDDVIKVHVVPLVDSVNGEFFVTVELDAIVASQDNYSIPYRSIGRTLRDLKIKNTVTSDTRNCPYIEPEDIHIYKDTALNFGHYFRGDEIYLVPSVASTFSATESLEKWYKIRPSKLTKLTNAAKVSSIASTTVGVESAGSIVTGSVVDFVQGKSGNRIYSIDKTCTNVSSTTFTFASGDIPTGLAVGDYVVLAGFSPVVTMIPDECSPYIETMAAMRLLKAIGDTEGGRDLVEDAVAERKNLLELLEPRNEGEPKIIINRESLARGGKFYQRRWMYGGS
jgi:hypothetical protein